MSFLTEKPFLFRKQTSTRIKASIKGSNLTKSDFKVCLKLTVFFKIFQKNDLIIN